MNIRYDMSKLNKGLSQYQLKQRHALEVYGMTSAQKMLAYSKKNASWRDISGHARQRMQYVAHYSGDKFICGIQHGVHYGVYLEYAHKKRYAILEPTIEKLSPEIFAGLEALLEGGK